MSDNRIEQAWLAYRAKVVPPNADQYQVRDTRDAFYSGAWLLLGQIMCGLAGGPVDEPPTEQDVELLRALQNELDVWRAEIELRYSGKPQ